MRVYRVETAEGTGVYNAVGGFRLGGMSSGWRHPGPMREGLMEGVMRGYVCGFRSLAQGGRWFSVDPEVARHVEEMPEMNPSGLAVSVYEVPEEAVLHGKRQVMFDKEEAELIDVLPVEALTTAGWLVEEDESKMPDRVAELIEEMLASPSI